jgi:hypothetical protein
MVIGIVAFEKFGSDKKRTLINRLITCSCYSVLQASRRTVVKCTLKTNGKTRVKIKTKLKDQREGNTPPPPIAILLVLKKPKISFKFIFQPTIIKFLISLHFQFTIILCQLFKN